MNYIKHLSAFLEKISSDYRLNPSHVSLYMALFHFWNLNRFENPISISRSQSLKVSKIGSNHTYHKCLRELSEFGYICYKPSHNPLRGSLIYMCIFDTSTEQVLHQFSDKNETSIEQALHPSINIINNTNNKTRERGNNSPSQKSDSEILKKKKTGIRKRRKVAEKKESKFVLPALADVLDFFKSENYPELEAKKYFNHFQSNGWKVSGKTPMKDWHAAARKWMLNTQNFTPPTQNNANPGPTHLNKNKRYDIPL